MNYKLSTCFLGITTAVFAGLYFTSVDSSVTVTETTFVKSPQTQVKEFKSYESSQPALAEKAQNVEARVIVKEVSSHPEYASEKIDDMAFMYETFLKSHTNRIKHSYPLLFERLSLDEDGMKILSRLLSEREMVTWMRSHNLSEDEKQELADRKEEMKGRLNQQIADLLGSEAAIFEDYESKKKQYQQIASLKGKMEDSGDFDIAAQDELAGLMQESRDMHKEMYKDDWKALRESKEKADEFLSITSERYKQLSENADFLNSAQKEIFGSYLNKVYQRYERAAKHYNKRRKSSSEK